MTGQQSIISECAGRLERAAERAAEAGLDAVLVTPGGNLEYLTGYRGSITTERITCLVLVPGRDPVVLLPRLERAVAEVAMTGGPQLELVTWDDGEDPLDRLAALLPDGTGRIGVDAQMWSERSLGLAARLPQARQVSAGPLLLQLRAVKSPAELAALAQAAAAIDSVHARMGEWLRAGRTEREIGADIAAAILGAGHLTVEFVIVGSGPNGASPHHELSDRVVQPGEPVVVDIGGRMPSGYNSDCTRTYVVGEPSAEIAALYAVLQRAQAAQCEAAGAGITASELDAVGRRIIAEAGYGEYFLHRTGHGIGLEVHEEPYVVAGSPLPLPAGATFSIEPGIYLPGVGGARIEDIVACEPGGGRRLNLRPRDLQVLPG
ncbi:MAG TPA: Xaa-Pro peptidase family protein [Kineosporiaceae bacterium]|nr:Xaa-Pro peptidase family protein [Kineosporiaceae bacterium]